jgi:type I restriction enzyme M protein
MKSRRTLSYERKKRLFDKDERINLRPDVIKSVVARLEHFDMFGIDEDLNGRLFETFLSATMRGRDLGQFFTPRSVVKMMTRLANLGVDQMHQDKELDACCGSGRFLIEALTVM